MGWDDTLVGVVLRFITLLLGEVEGGLFVVLVMAET
jgi:hypothetical protein